MAGWVAIVSPLLFRAGGDKGPFDPGQPLEGLLRLGAVIGVVLCLAARTWHGPGSPPQPSLINRGTVGPLTGGILLVTISGFTALSAPTAAVYAVLLAAGLGTIAVRFAVPPVRVLVRRALVGPFVVVAAGLYETVIDAIVGPHEAAAVRQSALLDPRAAEPFLFFLAAFSAIYFAMLIYAPRQIAEREGGAVEWVLRYAAFVVSIVLGIGWLRLLSA
jgi:hypothetical protein